MSAPTRHRGRVTPKGVRPAGVTPRTNDDRPDAALGRYVVRRAPALPTQRPTAGRAPGPARRGNRGGR